jgi:ABC-type branched-subunit amino acid transport system substrate-binding protein
MSVEGKYLGAYLAAQEINASGGVMGRDIQIVSLDDGGSASVGINAATRFYNDGINIIVGADWSSVTLAVARSVCIPRNMLMISYSSTNPSISTLKDSNLVWRTCPSDAFQGQVGAVYCARNFGKKKAAILAMNNPWALGLAHSFADNFAKQGGTVCHFGIYPELPGDEAAKHDYTAHLDSLFEKRPDVVYLAAFPSDGAKITNDIAAGHFLSGDNSPLFFSNDGLYTNYFLLNGNVDIIDRFYGTVPGTATGNVNYEKYSKAYRSRWGYDPVPFSEYAYDATYLLALAIAQNQGSPDPRGLSKLLRGISGVGNSTTATKVNVGEFAKGRSIIEGGGQVDYDGASGSIDFDSNGDPGSGTYIIWRIKDGAYITDTVVVFP